MKARNGQIDFSEMPPYKLGRHWNTIQSYLILGIEDDIALFLRYHPRSSVSCQPPPKRQTRILLPLLYTLLSPTHQKPNKAPILKFCSAAHNFKIDIAKEGGI